MISFKPTLSDKVTDVIGSWKFIIGQALVLICYVLWNTISPFTHFDPYPFIFMNLILSLQAAFTAPLILMSHNRMAGLDRELATLDRENVQRILFSIKRLESTLIKEVDEAVEEIKEAVEELDSDEET